MATGTLAYIFLSGVVRAVLTLITWTWSQLNDPAKLICLDGATSTLLKDFTLKSEVVLQGGSGAHVDAFSVFC